MGEKMDQIGICFPKNFMDLRDTLNWIFFMLGFHKRAFRLKPVQITFPRYDPDGFAKGDLSSAATAVSIDKYVSQDLSLLAPDVVELLDRFLPILRSSHSSPRFC